LHPTLVLGPALRYRIPPLLFFPGDLDG